MYGVLIAALTLIAIVVVLRNRKRLPSSPTVEDRHSVLCSMIKQRLGNYGPPPEHWTDADIDSTPESAILDHVETQVWLYDGLSSVLTLSNADKASLRSALDPSVKRLLNARHLALSDDLVSNAVERAYQWTLHDISTAQGSSSALTPERCIERMPFEEAVLQYKELEEKNTRTGDQWRTILSRRVDSDELWRFDVGARAGLVLIRRGREIARMSLMYRSISHEKRVPQSEHTKPPAEKGAADFGAASAVGSPAATGPSLRPSQITKRLLEKAEDDFGKLSHLFLVDWKVSVHEAEVRFLAGAIVSSVFFLFGASDDTSKEQQLDQFTRIWLQRLVQKIPMQDALKRYRQRFAEYDPLLRAALLKNSNAAGSPFITLGLHVYECVSGSSARGAMLNISVNAPKLVEIVSHDIDHLKGL